MDYWHSQIILDDIPSSRLYKLTNQSFTSDGVRWNVGEKKTAPGERLSTGRYPISKNWIQAFSHPMLAALLGRVYDRFDHPIMFECEGFPKYQTADGRVFCTELTTKSLVTYPVISPLTRIRFALGCVMKIFPDEKFREWVLDWYSNKRRTVESAKNMINHCKFEVETESKINITTKVRISEAAQLACWACVAHSDQSYYPNNAKLVDYWTGLAAMQANKAAYLGGIDFDLVTLAEIAMSAR